MSRIAALQMTSTPILAENLSIAAQLIQQAANFGAQLIALPEMFVMSGFDLADKLKIKETLDCGPIQDFLATQAQKHRLYIVGGTIPIHCKDSNKARAACLVYDSNGHRIGRYDKMHLFDACLDTKESYCESNSTEAGNHLAVIDTPLGRLGLAVCYDLRFPELFRHLANQGAEIFILPAAFAQTTGQAHWEILLRARAIENFCYMLAPGQGGTHRCGRQTFGHSMIVAPWGNIIAEADATQTCVIQADINLQEVHMARQKIPILQHQKLYSTK